MIDPEAPAGPAPRNPRLPSAAAGFEFNRPTIVALRYLGSAITGISGLVGLILAMSGATRRTRTGNPRIMPT